LEGSSVRILVVDDFERWRHFVCLALHVRREWQVIGEASDGVEAVHKAKDLQPDLVVLDIGLPTLSGIDAARQIRALSPRSKILFLSENRSPEITEEALHTGAGGYVVKSNAASDLIPAVEAVLHGKRFVSARLAGHDFADSTQVLLAPIRPQSKPGRHCHEAEFYRDDASFANGFAHFVEAALKMGNAVVVIATESHRTDLRQKLWADGVDLGIAVAQKRYVALDAAETLSTITVNDAPDPTRFLEVAGHLIMTAAQSARGDHPRVAICGECDPPLWTVGNGELQIRVEQLWNLIATTYDVDILCGYSLAVGQAEMDAELLQRICAEHSNIHSL